MLVKPPLAGVGTFKQLVRRPVQAARREPSMQDALPRPAAREIPRAGNEWKRLRVPCRAGAGGRRRARPGGRPRGGQGGRQRLVGNHEREAARAGCPLLRLIARRPRPRAPRTVMMMPCPPHRAPRPAAQSSTLAPCACMYGHAVRAPASLPGAARKFLCRPAVTVQNVLRPKRDAWPAKRSARTARPCQTRNV